MKNRVKGLTFLLLALGVQLKLSAQQDMQFSQYTFHKMYYNPAAVGIDPDTRFSLLHRSQWLGYKGEDGGGAPSTQLFSANHPFAFPGSHVNNAGVGLYFINDKIGPIRNVQAKLGLAYQIDLTGVADFLNQSKLSFGVNFGIWNQSIDTDAYRYLDNNDQIIGSLESDRSSQTRPDMNVGLMWLHNSGSYIGMSFNHPFRSTFDFDVQDDLLQSEITNHYYLLGGYFKELNESFDLLPNFHLQTDFNFTTFNIGSNLNYKLSSGNVAIGGLNLRQSFGEKGEATGQKRYSVDDLVLLLGFETLKDKTNSINQLRITYAFDLITSGRDAKAATSHEIMVTYRLPTKTPTPDAPPRYIREIW